MLSSHAAAVLAVAVLCISPISVGLLCAQSDKTDSPSVPKDVDGWGKIKWGMTLEAVQAAYGPSEVKEIKRLGDTLSLNLNSVKAADTDLHVYVYAPSLSDQVRKVELSVVVTSAKDRIRSALKTLLIEKYGAPTNEEAEHNTGFGIFESRSLWIFPSTSIILLTGGTYESSAWMIRITYEPRAKSVL